MRGSLLTVAYSVVVGYRDLSPEPDRDINVNNTRTPVIHERLDGDLTDGAPLHAQGGVRERVALASARPVALDPAGGVEQGSPRPRLSG